MQLFVANLNYSLSDDEMLEVFAAFGDVVKCYVAMDRELNRSRGFGFVTFADANDARRAIEALDGKELAGRAIVVRESVPTRTRTRELANR